MAGAARARGRDQHPRAGRADRHKNRTQSLNAPHYKWQVLREREGAISIRELGELTAIKTDDIISTLQFLNLIQYQKGQHVLCAAPDVLDRHLRSAGSPGLEVRMRRVSLLAHTLNLQTPTVRNA